MSDFQQFLDIRKAYEPILPVWISDYERTGNMRHDPYFMDWQFTPIERDVWCDIRTLGIPFYPQVPALNYFLDFACPMLKIGIECDGKAWHEYELDKARDARLAAAGWMIFRIEGHECKRSLSPFSEYDRNDEDPVEIMRFYMETSEGVLNAIKHRYFDSTLWVHNKHLIEATLFNHRSTPETFPIRINAQSTGMPELVSTFISDYVDRLTSRLKMASR